MNVDPFYRFIFRGCFCRCVDPFDLILVESRCLEYGVQVRAIDALGADI